MLALIKKNIQDKLTLNLWMNHLLVIYAFLFPISLYSSSFIFSLILILFLIRRNFKEYLLPIIKKDVVQAFMLFFLIHILWLYGTENFIQAKHSINVVKYSLFPLIFLSFIDKKFAKYIIIGFITGMLFSEIFSYALQFHILPWEYSIANIPIYSAAAVGDPSPFLNHSHYASSLAFVSIILIYKLIKNTTTNFEKFISLSFIISISTNLSLIGGRIGYILYIILILFLIAFIYRKKFLTPLLIFTILVGGFFTLAYNFSPLFQQRISQTQTTIAGFSQGKTDFTTSLGQRVGFWYYSTDVIKSNPIFGVGTGDYLDAVRKIIPDNENNYIIKHELEHPHNIYIQLLLQFGVIGLFAFLYLIYKIIIQKTESEYMQFVKYAIIITLLISLLTETFIYRYYLPVFIIIVSATLSSSSYIKSNEILFSKKTVKIYILLLLLAILNAKLHYIIVFFQSLIG